jgi:DNA repair ATPase RecN
MDITNITTAIQNSKAIIAYQKKKMEDGKSDRLVNISELTKELNKLDLDGDKLTESRRLRDHMTDDLDEMFVCSHDHNRCIENIKSAVDAKNDVDGICEDYQYADEILSNAKLELSETNEDFSKSIKDFSERLELFTKDIAEVIYPKVTDADHSLS